MLVVKGNNGGNLIRMENHSTAFWPVVLAGGEGARLRELTTTGSGVTIPKQFCSLNRRECLIELALQRAKRIAAPEHACTIVAAQHRRWWKPVLNGLAATNIFVQPRNRGTAIGVALALVQLERLDPDAIAILLPSDHYVSDETILTDALEAAGRWVQEDREAICLLGTPPEFPDTELGYIVPVSGAQPAAVVREFVEKPSMAQARDLIAQGALWNMFIVVGAIQRLLRLLDSNYNFVAPIRSVVHSGIGSLRRLYEELPTVDFSRDVLAHGPGALHVVSVPACGWTDLGTPTRVASVVREVASAQALPALHAGRAVYWNLAQSSGSR
jgi:mannose-1-phosphate guanylyltransferase